MGYRVKNSRTRYYLYRMATRMIQGHLGKGNVSRSELYIRHHFPNEDDTDFIGFKEYEDAIESEFTDYGSDNADY